MCELTLEEKPVNFKSSADANVEETIPTLSFKSLHADFYKKKSIEAYDSQICEVQAEQLLFF